MYSESFANITLLDGLKDSVLGIGVVFLMLAFLIIVISLMGKLRLGDRGKKAPALTSSADTSLPAAPSDSVELIDVDEKSAALIMAIVADETKIPLEELRFISIKGL